jgi:hypothetical protein
MNIEMLIMMRCLTERQGYRSLFSAAILADLLTIEKPQQWADMEGENL